MNDPIVIHTVNDDGLPRALADPRERALARCRWSVPVEVTGILAAPWWRGL